MSYISGGFPSPPPPPPTVGRWYERGWAKFRSSPLWVRIPIETFVGLFLLGAVASPFVDEEAPGRGETADAQTTTTGQDTTTAPTTTTTDAPTTTTSPTTTTPPPPAIYEGVGTQVVEISLPDPNRAAIAAISHTGGRNFAVWELDANLQQVDLLVNTIGNYIGNVPVNLKADVTTSSLEITADGTWRVEITPVSTARTFDAEISGTGDDVFTYRGQARVVALSHQGDGNFAL